MKRFFALGIVIVMLFASVAVSAEETYEEFSIDNAFVTKAEVSDEMMLMESDVKDELEKRLVEAWTDMEPGAVVDISDLKIHRDDIVSLYSLIFFENPMFYYVEKGFGGHSNSATGLMGDIVPRYTLTDKSIVEAKWEEYDKATEEILLYINNDMTDFEKIMTVHDYMVFNYVYDITDPDQTMEIILDKVGVCAAYAEVFQHMMNVLGIECTVVRSNDMGHIWNLVQLDGKWYHIDVTWDDIVPDEFAGVNHQYAFLSTAAIEAMGHYNFDMAGYVADSTLYDAAPWRDERGAIAIVDGVMYRVEGNEIVDENNNVIFSGLDGGDGKWHLSKTASIPGNVFAGVCELNGKLYFNTDEGIYSYDPQTKTLEMILETYGACGIYADANVLRYSTYDYVNYLFVEAGEERISDVRVSEPYYEDGEAVVRLYNDSDSPLWVISKGDTYKLAEITDKGVHTLRFDNGEEQVIYIWKNNMEPYFEKIVIAE